MCIRDRYWEAWEADCRATARNCCMTSRMRPLAEGKHGIFTHPVLTKIGEKYGKTAAQVALRWNAQRGVVIIPKSTHRERMAENFSIWDFALTDGDMAAIAALDLGRSEIIDHGSAETARFLNGWKIHD